MDLDWTPSTMFSFYLNTEDFEREDAMELLIGSFMRDFEDEYGMYDEDVTMMSTAEGAWIPSAVDSYLVLSGLTARTG